MRMIFFLASLFCYQSIMAQSAGKRDVSLADFEGEWFINMTNFPMWLKGDKLNPTFNYSIVEKKKTLYLFDQVKYEKKEKEKSIVGYDHPKNAENTAFRWRGKGLLKLLKSDWKVLNANKEEEWMIVYFEKTLFTPEGYDVISRDKTLSAAVLKKVRDLLETIEPGLELTVLDQD